MGWRSAADGRRFSAGEEPRIARVGRAVGPWGAFEPRNAGDGRGLCASGRISRLWRTVRPTLLLGHRFKLGHYLFKVLRDIVLLHLILSTHRLTGEKTGPKRGNVNRG